MNINDKKETVLTKTEGIEFQQPPVIRIHPGVLTGIYIGIVLLGAIMATAVFWQYPPLPENTSATATLPLDNEAARWYQQEPDRITIPPVPSVSPDDAAETKESAALTPSVSPESQREAEARQAALDSPIKVPLNDLTVTTYSSPLDRVQASDDAIAPNASGLTLTDKQTARLQQLFGDKNVTQERKQFLNNLQKNTDDDYLHTTLKKPLSPYVLQAGSLIPATLIGGINSELPGQLTALVRQNVYDSIRGRYLLIPQGTKLILTYDAHVAYGQSRVLVAVKRLIFPNGNSMNLQGMPGVDSAGFAGFHDEVDNHYVRLFGSGAMMGLISAGFQLSQPQQSNMLTAPSASQVMGAAMGQQMGEVAMGMMNKNMEIAPTLLIRPGYQFNVQVTADMVFPGSY